MSNIDDNLYGEITEWNLDRSFYKSGQVRAMLNSFLVNRMNELDAVALQDGDVLKAIKEIFELFRATLGSSSVFNQANANREVNYVYLAQRLTLRLQNDYLMPYYVTKNGDMRVC